MCLVSLCIQDASFRIWLVLIHFLFSRYWRGTCNSVWVALDSPTITFKGCILDVFCYISPVRRDWKFESFLQFVDVLFGSLLCTTEASNVRANLPLFTHWFCSICCRGEDRWWGRCSLDIFFEFCIWGQTTIHEIIEDHGSVSGTATERSFSLSLRTKYLVEKLSRPVCSLRFTLFKWPFSYTLHIHAHLMPVSAVTTLYHRFPQFHSRLVYNSLHA